MPKVRITRHVMIESKHGMEKGKVFDAIQIISKEEAMKEIPGRRHGVQGYAYVMGEAREVVRLWESEFEVIDE